MQTNQKMINSVDFRYNQKKLRGGLAGCAHQVVPMPQLELYLLTHYKVLDLSQIILIFYYKSIINLLLLDNFSANFLA